MYKSIGKMLTLRLNILILDSKKLMDEIRKLERGKTENER